MTKDVQQQGMGWWRWRGRMVVVACMLVLASPHAGQAQPAHPVGTSSPHLHFAPLLPTRLGMETAHTEIQAGTSWHCRVFLQDLIGRETPALQSVTVEVQSELLTSRSHLVIPVGQSSATATFTFPSPGIDRVAATAQGFQRAEVIVLVRVPGIAGRAVEKGAVAIADRATPEPVRGTRPGSRPGVRPKLSLEDILGEPAHPEAMGGGRATGGGLSSLSGIGGGHGPTSGAPASTPSQATPGPPKHSHRHAGPPVESVPPGTAPGAEQLAVAVVPHPMRQDGTNWTGKVIVYTLDRRGQPVAVDRDVPITWAATRARMNPSAIVIAKGTGFAQGIITSASAGDDEIQAWSPIGQAQLSVSYLQTPPVALRVEAAPAQTTNSGRNPIMLTVILLDRDGRPANALHDVDVTLNSTLGTIEPRTIRILRDTQAANAFLTSTSSGEAEIRAWVQSLPETTTRARFIFPWLMIGLASMGGFAGAALRARRTMEGGVASWLPHTVATGALLGLLVYALASFGAVASIPKITVAIDKIPTMNELGAFVLGCLGGYGGLPLLGKSAGRATAPEPVAGKS